MIIFFWLALMTMTMPTIARLIADHATRIGLRYIAGSYPRYRWLALARDWRTMTLRWLRVRPYGPWLLLAGLLSLLLT